MHLWISDVCDSIFRTLETLSAVSFLSWPFSLSVFFFFFLFFQTPIYEWKTWSVLVILRPNTDFLHNCKVSSIRSCLPQALWEHVRLSTQGTQREMWVRSHPLTREEAMLVYPVSALLWFSCSGHDELLVEREMPSVIRSPFQVANLRSRVFSDTSFMVVCSLCSEMRLILCSGETQQLLV